MTTEDIKKTAELLKTAFGTSWTDRVELRLKFGGLIVNKSAVYNFFYRADTKSKNSIAIMTAALDILESNQKSPITERLKKLK